MAGMTGYSELSEDQAGMRLDSLVGVSSALPSVCAGGRCHQRERVIHTFGTCQAARWPSRFAVSSQSVRNACSAQ
jgi:hypothetical protein